MKRVFAIIAAVVTVLGLLGGILAFSLARADSVAETAAIRYLPRTEFVTALDHLNGRLDRLEDILWATRPARE